MIRIIISTTTLFAKVCDDAGCCEDFYSPSPRRHGRRRWWFKSCNELWKSWWFIPCFWDHSPCCLLWWLHMQFLDKLVFMQMKNSFLKRK